jgi:hypothetical protein
VRLRLLLPRGRGRAGLSSLRRQGCSAALLLLAAALCFGACGTGSPHGHVTHTTSSTRVVSPSPPAVGPAFGLTEDNADLLWNPAQRAPSGGANFASARAQLTALHPRYLRLLIDWAALQPTQAQAPALDASVSGCARTVAPCGAYAGVREQLAAIRSQQRAAAAEGRVDFQVVLDIFGAPAWAARGPSGCELTGTRAFSRPVSEAGIAGYRALIHALLKLAAGEGVTIDWWSPWNEPNDPVFISPQRTSCSADSPPVSPAEYAVLARAMDSELQADGDGTQRLLLGELNAFQSDSPHRTSISQFVAALPADVICLSDVWSIHAYAARGAAKPAIDPVKALEAALDARGGCAAHASIWVTEAGAGARHPGRAKRASAGEERAGCLALAEQLIGWASDPRVGAIFQYTFREDPAFPVGLLSADLEHAYSPYRLWLAYTRRRSNGALPSSPEALCT